MESSLLILSHGIPKYHESLGSIMAFEVVVEMEWIFSTCGNAKKHKMSHVVIILKSYPLNGETC